jgi:thiol-disulfide isomerase/thioredoxin
MSVEPSQTAKQIRNLVVVAIASLLSVALVLGLQTRSPAASLSDMAEAAVPLDTALANGKPTLIEFYANWCTSCQAMAPDIAQLKSDYTNQVNFVMLNVDNTKWLPEMLNYRVDGIPHFEFLSADGTEKGTAIGEMPRLILAENLDALMKKQPLPHAQISGTLSAIDAATNPINPQATDEQSSSPKKGAKKGPTKSPSADPRSHGAQVVN